MCNQLVRVWCSSLVLLMLSPGADTLTPSDYMKMRSEMIDDDESSRIGANLVLSAAELKVNSIFMKEKRAMIESSLINRTIYSPSTSFYYSKSEIDQTYLYQLIHRMPKGFNSS
uniref:Adenosine/AMP deaminase N-terminal domain-containing protein n=1 Tax=Biomphalaria glabrata TaxID=6526 RepID=A0A2C9L1E7_BIOGL